MPSNARVFEQMGSPWVSEKEGRENYGRTLETENPETDKDWYAKRAPERAPDITAAVSNPRPVADNHRRRCNIAARMNGRLNKNKKPGERITRKNFDALNRGGNHETASEHNDPDDEGSS